MLNPFIDRLAKGFLIFLSLWPGRLFSCLFSWSLASSFAWIVRDPFFISPGVMDGGDVFLICINFEVWSQMPIRFSMLSGTATKWMAQFLRLNRIRGLQGSVESCANIALMNYLNYSMFCRDR